MSGLAALHRSTFAQGFSNNERRAAARALLRHNVHIDGTHYQTRMLGGLHPSYIAFQPIQQLESERTLSQKELCEGGAARHIRCGSDAISLEKIALDLYITPRELHETSQQIGGDVAVLVQAFAQEFTIPHLQRFTKHCAIEKTQVPKYFSATHISMEGPQYLPAPVIPTGARILCSAQVPKSFVKNLQTSSPAVTDSKKATSAAICQGVEWATSVGTKMNPSTPCSRIHQCWPADVFTADKDPGPIFSAQSELNHEVQKFDPLPISIAPNTDSALDRFKLGDELLPKLHVVLLADLQGTPLIHEIVKTMSSQSLYTSKNVSRRVRMQHPHTHPKVTLSKEAHAMLMAGRCAKSHKFKAALNGAWDQFDDMAKTITAAHHKNKQGRDTLTQLVREHKDEYLALPKEEQDTILNEYVDWTKTKTTGTQISTKSKIIDVTQTLKAVENELNSLRCHTGAETILYTTHGSTNLPLTTVIFSTEGVQNFMHSVMNIDNQDFGLRKITKRKITGNPHANMQWTHYFRNIVQCYQVMIVGWPDSVPFTNLSKVSSSLSELERLFDLWDKHLTCWKTLMDEEFVKIYQEHNEKLENGQIEDIRRCTRSDKGKKRKRSAATNSNDRNTAQHKKYKSAETIEDSDKENDENDGRETTPPPSPRQLFNATPNLTTPNLTTPTSPLPTSPSSHLSVPSIVMLRWLG
ncbi:hypothetical protein F4604DRAFT_1683833 [Suillus subluteus]|nr:hypothetical protein F4604DRAFT_1683833 [Suillus subluteus]